MNKTKQTFLDAAYDWSKYPKLAAIFKDRPRVNVYWQELAALIAETHGKSDADPPAQTAG